MKFSDFKTNNQLSTLFDEFLSHYFNNKDNSILEILLKIQNLFVNLSKNNEVSEKILTLYKFTLSTIPEYYLKVLDTHKAIRFFKGYVNDIKKIKNTDPNIFLIIYSNVGDLYLEANNRSKAYECLTICKKYINNTKVTSYETKFLECSIMPFLDKQEIGFNGLIQLLNVIADDNLYNIFFKEKIVLKLKSLYADDRQKQLFLSIAKKRLLSLFDLSNSFAENNKLYEAITTLKLTNKYFTIFAKSDLYKNLYPESNLKLAKYLYFTGYHQSALTLFEEGIEYSKKNPMDSNLKSELEIGLIRTAQLMKNYSYALKIIKATELKADAGRFIKHLIRVNFEKAVCRSKFGNDENALEIFKNIEIKLFPKLKDKDFLTIYKVKINNERSFILQKKYEFEPAISLYRNSIQQLHNYKTTNVYAETLKGIASILCRLKDKNEESLKFFQEAYEIFRNNCNTNQLIITMKNISDYYFRSGEIDEAILYINDATQLLELRENFQELPIFYSQKAKIYLLQNKFTKAERFFKKDLSITKKTDNIHSLAFSHYHLGIVYQKLDLIRVADTHLKKSLEYFNIVANVKNKLPVLNLLAINNAKSGIEKLVKRYIGEAEDLWKETRDRILQAKISLTKGICYNLLGKKGKNIENLFYNSIRLISNLEPDHLDLLEAYEEFANYFEKNRNKRQAVIYLKKGIELSEKIGLADRAAVLLKKLSLISEVESQRLKLQTLTGDIDDDFIESEDNLHVDQKYITVFFIDIRGFTTVAEKTDIKKLQIFLNDFYSTVIKCINANNGMVNKFIGDSVLALFGVNEKDKQPEYNAVKSSIEIINRIEYINKRRVPNGGLHIDVGIGLAAGNVLLGTFGSAQRKDYTAIGDTVNLAARLQGIAAKSEIIIDDSIYDKVSDKFQIETCGETTVKGKTQKIKFFKVILA